LERKCRAQICRKPEENKKKKLTYSIMKKLATNAKRKVYCAQQTNSFSPPSDALLSPLFLISYAAVLRDGSQSNEEVHQATTTTSSSRLSVWRKKRTTEEEEEEKQRQQQKSATK
jgi:hypothetical protein